MPDQNKMETLRRIGYRVFACCATCKYSIFRRNTEWGMCMLNEHRYTHGKHGREHNLSIHKGGGCRGNYAIDEKTKEDLTKSGFMS